MLKSYILLFLMFLSLEALSQCENGDILYYDSIGNEVEANTLLFSVSVNNELKKLNLESLHLTDFNKGRMATIVPGCEEEVKSSQPNTAMEKENHKLENSFNCIKCSQETIEITDSVDVNGDGTKELVLLRKGVCSSSPRIPIGCCGVGIKDQAASQYEIWDRITQTCLFTIRSTYSFSEAVTTNVGYTDQYRFDVEIDKNGVVNLSNLVGDKHICKQEMGMFQYDKSTKQYRKK